MNKIYQLLFLLLIVVLLSSGCSNSNISSVSEYRTSTGKNLIQRQQVKESKQKSSNSTNQTNRNQKNTNLFSVTKVVDGDTIVINKKNTRETVRLIGIDTPETKHPNKPVQCFGEKASKKMKDLVEGKQVKLKKDGINANKDKYNRLLRYIYLQDGTLVNAEMVKQGFSYAYLQFPFEYSDKFRRLEKQAREDARGLWSEDTCSGERYPSSQVDSQPREKTLETKKDRSLNYDCSKNKYNCSDFKTHQKAQAVYEACGGSSNDIHNLDRERDRKACESLP